MSTGHRSKPGSRPQARRGHRARTAARTRAPWPDEPAHRNAGPGARRWPGPWEGTLPATHSKGAEHLSNRRAHPSRHCRPREPVSAEADKQSSISVWCACGRPPPRHYGHSRLAASRKARSMSAGRRRQYCPACARAKGCPAARRLHPTRAWHVVRVPPRRQKARVA